MADSGTVGSATAREGRGAGVGPVVGDVSFDASAESIAQARRLVATQLSEWGLAVLADDARLVASELLTNAVLHAQPPIAMLLTRLVDGVRLEVSDGSSDTPLLVRAGTDVMTGRGWTLVEALCHDWGVVPTDTGKVVWATLQLASAVGDSKVARPDSGLSARVDSQSVMAELMALAAPLERESAEERYEVSLGDVPTELLMAAKAHIDALIREFALMASGATGGRTPVPAELTTLIERVVGNFSEARQSIKRQALRAVDAHDARTQLSLYLPLSAADAGLAYLAALDEVDAYCRAEQLLTLESPPSHRVFRRWYVEELAAGLHRAADPEESDPHTPESFETRLLREFDTVSEQARRAIS